MRQLRPFAIGLTAGMLAAGAATYVAFERQSRPSPGEVSGLASALAQPPSSPSRDKRPTRDTLLSWQATGTPPERIKSQIMDAALSYFTEQENYDVTKLRRQVVLLSAGDYSAKSVSSCEDASDVRPPTEAWLLDVRGDQLFVNDGFTSTSRQSVIDLFFRYTIGLYSLAPKLRSYPNGVTSSDGRTAYYEKGLILLGRRVLDQLTNTNCYLQYRAPIEAAFTADHALDLLARLRLAPAPEYVYPQKASLEAYRARIAPRLGATADQLLEPFLKTQSAEFYRRVGRALGSGGDPAASEAAADRLFREVFPDGLKHSSD